MKMYARKLLLLSFCFIVVLSAEADELGPAAAPVATVQAMVTTMKSGEGFAGLMRFVHWQTAYDALDETQRQSMDIDSAEKLRSITLAFMADPEKALEQQLAKQFEKLPAEQAELLKQFLATQQQRLRQKLDEVKQRMKESEYTVGEAEIADDRATVALTSVYEGSSSTKEIVLQKIDSLWYLPSSTLSGLGSGNADSFLTR